MPYTLMQTCQLPALIKPLADGAGHTFLRAIAAQAPTRHAQEKAPGDEPGASEQMALAFGQPPTIVLVVVTTLPEMLNVEGASLKV